MKSSAIESSKAITSFLVLPAMSRQQTFWTFAWTSPPSWLALPDSGGSWYPLPDARLLIYYIYLDAGLMTSVSSYHETWLQSISIKPQTLLRLRFIRWINNHSIVFKALPEALRNTQAIKKATNVSMYYACGPSHVWRARSDSNARPPGS